MIGDNNTPPEYLTLRPHYIVFRDRPGDRGRFTLERWEIGALRGQLVVSVNNPERIVEHIPDGYAPTGTPIGEHMTEVWVHKSVSE